MKKILLVQFILSLTVCLIMNIGPALADDLSEFKKVVETYNAARANWDIDKLIEFEANSIGLSSDKKSIKKFKLVDKEILKKGFETFLSKFEYNDQKFFIHHIELLDEIGIATGVFNFKIKAKEYPEVTGKKRWSSTWVKSDENWKLIFYHREYID